MHFSSHYCIIINGVKWDQLVAVGLYAVVATHKTETKRLGTTNR